MYISFYSYILIIFTFEENLLFVSCFGLTYLHKQISSHQSVKDFNKIATNTSTQFRSEYPQSIPQPGSNNYAMSSGPCKNKQIKSQNQQGERQKRGQGIPEAINSLAIPLATQFPQVSSLALDKKLLILPIKLSLTQHRMNTAVDAIFRIKTGCKFKTMFEPKVPQLNLLKVDIPIFLNLSETTFILRNCLLQPGIEPEKIQK